MDDWNTVLGIDLRTTEDRYGNLQTRKVNRTGFQISRTFCATANVWFFPINDPDKEEWYWVRLIYRPWSEEGEEEPLSFEAVFAPGRIPKGEKGHSLPKKTLHAIVEATRVAVSQGYESYTWIKNVLKVVETSK
jgi:hypothetical protein